MSDSLLQRSVTTAVARNLATTTKTTPKMMSITPKYLLGLLPRVQVEGGTYRVNRTKVELARAQRIDVDLRTDSQPLSAESLRNVPLFSKLGSDLRNRMANRFRVEEISLGNNLVVEGGDRARFFIIASGQVEVSARGPMEPICDLHCPPRGSSLARQTSSRNNHRM